MAAYSPLLLVLHGRIMEPPWKHHENPHGRNALLPSWQSHGIIVEARCKQHGSAMEAWKSHEGTAGVP